MGDEPGNKISEEVRNEVKRRLADGESPGDISDDDGMPSRRSIYHIKDEYEQAKEIQEELERDVFTDSTEASRDDLVEVLERANVGIKQSGDPKAKVEKALNAIDFDDAWDDPHYVADTLVAEASMDREWANRIVRKTYDEPDFPYIDNPSGEQGRDGGAGRQRSRRSRRRNGHQQRNERRRQRNGRSNDRRQQRRDENPQLRQEMQQLRSTVTELAETVSEAVQNDDTQQTVTIEKDGNVMEVPADSPMAYNMMMGDDNEGDDDDFIDKLREAKEAGIIPDPDDFQQDDSPGMMETMSQAKELGLVGNDDTSQEVEMMSDMMEEMTEKFNEGLANVSTQMSAAISQLAEESDEDDDELSMEELEDWWEQKQKEDELDRLESELSEMKEELREQRRGRTRNPSDPEQDPDVVKKRIDTEHERDQLEMAKETIEEAPNQIAQGIQDGLLPVFDRLQASTPGDGHPAWSPPEQSTRGEPDYTPQQQPPNNQTTSAQRTGYPDQSSAEPTTEPEDESPPAEDNPTGITAEEAEDVRDKLGIGADSNDEQADA